VSTRAGTRSVIIVHLPARRETGPPDYAASFITTRRARVHTGRNSHVHFGRCKLPPHPQHPNLNQQRRGRFKQRLRYRGPNLNIIEQ